MYKQKLNKHNVKQIPTVFNYSYMLYKRIKKLRLHLYITRLLVISLIIWNCILSLSLYNLQQRYTYIPHFTKADNNIIMELEK